MRSTSPPEGAAIPDPDPGSPEPGTPIPSHYRWCFACGVDHPSGLHLRMATGTGLSVRGEFTVGEHHQGSPGVAHGGVLATAMDESLGYLNWLVGAPAVTARLQVDYKRPVPVGTTLFLEAEVTGVRGRKVYGRVVARLDATDGAIAVEATALFVQVSVEHFISAGNPELIERAFADRAEGGPGWRTGEHAFEVSP